MSESWLLRISDIWEVLCTVLHFRSHLRTSPIDWLLCGTEPCVFFHGSLLCWSRLMLCARWLSWLTAMDKGIVYLPSMPAQQEVINTGNLIQRQETPLPPTEFKLNALLLFLAKSRTACLGPAEQAVARPGQHLRRLFQQFLSFFSSLLWQTITISISLLPLLYSWVFHTSLFQNPLLFNIPITPTGPEYSLCSGIFMESLFYLYFFYFLLLLFCK